jgi:RNA polymerase sigma-70 factor (ECF subfamily)
MFAVASGDERAFGRVYAEVCPRLATLLGRLGADRATIDDLVHDTLLRLYEARRRYRKGESVLSWARTIARRLYIDRLRARATSAIAHAGFSSGIDTPDRLRAPDVLLEEKRAALTIDAAVENLPELQAEAFRMVHIDGVAFQDASKRLGATNLSLRLRSHRACKALRVVLAEAGLR